MEKQVMEYASGNEMAATAIRQIGYDLMGYYPITPSTQICICYCYFKHFLRMLHFYTFVSQKWQL